MTRFRRELRVDADDIQPYLDTADDIAETELLSAAFRRARTVRKPFFLRKREFVAVAKWKLRGQFGRVARHLRLNSAPEASCTQPNAKCFVMQRKLSWAGVKSAHRRSGA